MKAIKSKPEIQNLKSEALNKPLVSNFVRCSWNLEFRASLHNEELSP